MSFFLQAGTFLKQGVSNVRSFIFPKTPIKRASQAAITQPATQTRLSNQKQAQNTSFFGRVSSGFRTATDAAKKSFDRLSVGVKKLFVPKEIRTVKQELATQASNLATQGIRTLGDVLGRKIANAGQSGSPVDVRPNLRDRSIPVTNTGKPNFFDGFSFPFLASSPAYAEAIPAVPDTEPIPVSGGQTVVTQTSASSNLLWLVAIGGIIFFLSRGK